MLVVTESSSFLQDYSQNTFLIKIGGEILNENNFDQICSDIAILNEAHIHVVIVHGGGNVADDLSKKFDLQIKKINGRRITDQKTIDIMKMALGKVNTDIVAKLKAHKLKAVGIHGISIDLNVEKRKIKDIDYGLVGDIFGGNPDLLDILVEHDYIPVISPLCADKEGEVLNINADTVALEISKLICAEKVIILSDVSGVYTNINDSSTLISHLTVSKIKEMIKDKSVIGGMIPKLEACASVINSGIKEVHLINGKIDHALLQEICSNKNIGTIISKDNGLEVT